MYNYFIVLTAGLKFRCTIIIWSSPLDHKLRNLVDMVDPERWVSCTWLVFYLLASGTDFQDANWWMSCAFFSAPFSLDTVLLHLPLPFYLFVKCSKKLIIANLAVFYLNIWKTPLLFGPVSGVAGVFFFFNRKSKYPILFKGFKKKKLIKPIKKKNVCVTCWDDWHKLVFAFQSLAFNFSCLIHLGHMYVGCAFAPKD